MSNEAHQYLLNTNKSRGSITSIWQTARLRRVRGILVTFLHDASFGAFVLSISNLNSLFSLSHLTWTCAVMCFSCDDNEISRDDKHIEADEYITGSFGAPRQSSVLWDTIFRRPYRPQANASLFFFILSFILFFLLIWSSMNSI